MNKFSQENLKISANQYHKMKGRKTFKKKNKFTSCSQSVRKAMITKDTTCTISAHIIPSHSPYTRMIFSRFIKTTQIIATFVKIPIGPDHHDMA
jgi:hypothetical protein